MEFTIVTMLLIFLGGIVGGILGSLVGLGGGIIVVPMLTIFFNVPIHHAVAASVIAIIANSCGGAASYIRKRLTNVRVGMFLEMATAAGALTGALIIGFIAPQILYIIFGVVLFISVVPQIFKVKEELPMGVQNDRWTRWFGFASSYNDERLKKVISYNVKRAPFGFVFMYVAGIISALLGIGSGTFKVLALDSLMRLPLKVSTTTSTFMIGVTGAASAVVYFTRGEILPTIAVPVAIGILIGSTLGAIILRKLSNRALRLIFIPVLGLIGLQMILRGFGINFL